MPSLHAMGGGAMSDETTNDRLADAERTISSLEAKIAQIEGRRCDECVNYLIFQFVALFEKFLETVITNWCFR